MTDFATLRSDLQAYYAGNRVTDALAESFIRVAETMIYRKVRHRSMVTTTTLTLSSATVALPSDYRGIIQLSVANTAMDYLSPQKLRESRLINESWEAAGENGFTIEGTNLIFAPTPSGSPSADFTYWAALAALSASNTTNMLLQEHYDLFLYAGLHALYDWAEDSEQELKYHQKFFAVADEINTESLTQRAHLPKLRRTGTATP